MSDKNFWPWYVVFIVVLAFMLLNTNRHDTDLKPSPTYTEMQLPTLDTP